MSTENDRPPATGGYPNSGLFASRDDTYSSPGMGGGPGPGGGPPGRSGMYDDDEGYTPEAYSSGATTEFMPADTGIDEEVRKPRPGWHAGADFGLLVLRLVLGTFFLAHAGQKLFGWFNGGGIDGTAQFFGTLGFTSHTTLLAWVAGVTELVGGAFVLLGLFTPAGAAAILGLMVGAIWVKFNGNNFLGNVELESMYAAAAFALLFAGPGRVSLDRPTHWYRYPAAYGFVFLLIAAGGAATFVLVFR